MKNLKQLFITLSLLFAFSLVTHAGAITVKTMALDDSVKTAGIVRLVVELTDDFNGLDLGIILHQDEAAAAWNDALASTLVDNTNGVAPQLRGYDGSILNWVKEGQVQNVERNKQVVIWFSVDPVADTYSISSQMEGEATVSNFFTDKMSRAKAKGTLNEFVKYCTVFINDRNGQTTAAIKVIKDAEIVASIEPYLMFPKTIYGDTTDVATCDNVPYAFDGENLSVAGVYAKTLAAANGVDDSIVSIDLMVYPTYMMADTTDYSTSDAAFEAVGSQVLTASMVTLQSCKSCDSIIAEYVKLTYMANTYTDSVTVYDTTYVSVSDTLVFELVAGIDDNSASVVDVKIYPNPTTDLLNVSFSDITLLKNLSVALYDFSGKLVKDETVSATQSALDISTLAAGTYLLNIVSDGITLDTKVIIVK